jgi:hypothetical protein
MGRDELLGDAHEAEQPAVLVIQIDQLDHRLGRFGRSVFELAQLGLQNGSLLAHQVNHRRLRHGRSSSGRLGQRGDRQE